MAANLDVLKQKYQSVFAVAQRRGVVVKNAHIENDKLLLRASAPNDQIKNELWTAIKAVDPSYSDLFADNTIDASLKAPENTYEVVSGDTLSKIAKEHLGSANAWKQIFEANRDTIDDPDRIFPGQIIKLPPKPADA